MFLWPYDLANPQDESAEVYQKTFARALQEAFRTDLLRT